MEIPGDERYEGRRNVARENELWPLIGNVARGREESEKAERQGRYTERHCVGEEFDKPQDVKAYES